MERRAPIGLAGCVLQEDRQRLRGTSIIGGDIGAGILQRDELATARQGDRIVERSFSARDQPSRCGLICSDAVEGHPDLAHDKTSYDCGTGLCHSGLPGLSAG